jgi:hypothetical protein
MKIQAFSNVTPCLLVNNTIAVGSQYLAFSFTFVLMCVCRIFRLALDLLFATVIYVPHRQKTLILKGDVIRAKGEIIQLLNLLDFSPALVAT